MNKHDGEKSKTEDDTVERSPADPHKVVLRSKSLLKYNISNF